MSKNKRVKVMEEETSTNVKHPRLKSASRILDPTSSDPASIALPEILESVVVSLNTHQTAKKNESVSIDGEISVAKEENVSTTTTHKPQIDNLEKEEILASFEGLTVGEGKTREQAYKIISDIKGKSMKTNILRWLKEREERIRSGGEPKPDGRKERSGRKPYNATNDTGEDGENPKPRAKRAVGVKYEKKTPSRYVFISI